MTFGLVFLWLREKIASLLGWAVKNPAWALCVVFFVSTLWFWHSDAQKAKWIASEKSAQKAEVVIAKHDNDQAVASVVKLNGVVDDGYQKGLAVGRSQLAAYVAAHGVRGSGSSGNASTSSENLVADISSESGSGAATVAPARVSFTAAELTLWDTTYQDDQSCRTWANGIAKLFDGSHWPTPDEVNGTGGEEKPGP